MARDNKKSLILLHKIAMKLNSTLELKELLNLILDSCVEFTNADTGSLLIVNKSDGTLRIEVAKGLSQDVINNFQLKIGEGVTGWVAKTGKPLYLPDVSKDTKYVRVRDYIKSEMATPMIVENDVIGVVSVDSANIDAFSGEDLNLLTIVGAQAAQAIHNAKAYEDQRKRIKDHEILIEISKIIGTSLDLRDIFNKVSRIIKNRIKLMRASLVLLDRETGEAAIERAYGLKQSEIKRGRYKIGEGITGQVIKLGRPIGVRDISKDPMFLDKTGARKILKTQKSISFLCVPIKIQNEVVGALSADKSYAGEEEFKDDMRLLQIIAATISQAVKIHDMVSKQRKELENRNIYLRRRLAKDYKFQNIIGKSKLMQEVFDNIAMVASSKATVLIRGESGTGKELVAGAVHFNSPMKERPFIKVNCASIPEQLLESELFGHTKGSFTGAMSDKKGKFEIADRGSIFLDEIGDMSPLLQTKILRVLQEREFESIGSYEAKKVDVRIIAATNLDLENAVEVNKFREDLYYRLNVVPISLPPLRERKEDITLLIDHFLKKYNEENNKHVKISAEAVDLMLEYSWPGNVRELENCIERLVVLVRSDQASKDDLPLPIKSGIIHPRVHPISDIDAGKVTTREKSLLSDIEAIERERIIEVLDKCGGVQVKAAKILGITPRMLGYRIKKYKLNIGEAS